MLSESVLGNRDKLGGSRFCLNSYEQQQELDNRVALLMKSLQRTESLRNQTETARKNVSDDLSLVRLLTGILFQAVAKN